MSQRPIKLGSFKPFGNILCESSRAYGLAFLQLPLLISYATWLLIRFLGTEIYPMNLITELFVQKLDRSAKRALARVNERDDGFRLPGMRGTLAEIDDFIFKIYEDAPREERIKLIRSVVEHPVLAVRLAFILGMWGYFDSLRKYEAAVEEALLQAMLDFIQQEELTVQYCVVGSFFTVLDRWYEDPEDWNTAEERSRLTVFHLLKQILEIAPENVMDEELLKIRNKWQVKCAAWIERLEQQLI